MQMEDANEKNFHQNQEGFSKCFSENYREKRKSKEKHRCFYGGAFFIFFGWSKRCAGFAGGGAQC
jgi:hypothetical protein